MKFANRKKCKVLRRKAKGIEERLLTMLDAWPKRKRIDEKDYRVCGAKGRVKNAKCFVR